MIRPACLCGPLPGMLNTLPQRVRVACVVGARPNFVKIAPILAEFRRRSRFQPTLIHTGQHFSPEMSAWLLDELGIGEPDLNLAVGSASATSQTAQIMVRLEETFNASRPDLILVVGDVNSTLAAAVTGAQLRIPIAHVEAGLRSFDRTMPEEINRIVTDTLSDFLFVTEPSGVDNLTNEGIPASRIAHVGNVMIDTLLASRPRAARSDVLSRLGLQPRRFAVATLHRPANVDDPARLAALFGVLRSVASRMPVVFPVHPRTRQRLEAEGIGHDGLILCPPQGYLDFLCLMDNARLLLTDSGGIQEETTVLGVPCLTLRLNTERPITITHGTNRLIGVDPESILAAAAESLDAPMPVAPTIPLWDGRASARIADFLESRF